MYAKMTNSTKDDRRFYEDHCKVISERMNLFDFQKTRGTVKAPLYVPPTYLPPIPSCRKPLERMSEKSLTKHGSPVTDCEESDPLETSDEDVDSDNDTPDHSNESFENQRNRTRTLSRSPPRYGSTYKETCNMTSQRTRIYSGKENSNETSKKSHNISYVPKSAAASQSVPTFVNAKRCLLCVTIVVAVAIAMATRFETLAFPSQEVPVSGQNERKNTFLKDIKTIEKKFPNQEDYTWSAVQLGIEDIVLRSGRSMTSERPQKPWIFILYSNRPKELFCLAELLGKACSKALSSNNSLSLEPEEFGDEYGDTIFRLKPIIEERKAVVVHDLLKIDPGAIQAFHTMCDRENPLVQEAVYILTIVASQDKQETVEPEVFVGKLLTDTFKNKIPEDKLEPLITRLTDGPIFPVKPESRLTGCTL